MVRATRRYSLWNMFERSRAKKGGRKRDERERGERERLVDFRWRLWIHFMGMKCHRTSNIPLK